MLGVFFPDIEEKNLKCSVVFSFFSFIFFSLKPDYRRGSKQEVCFCLIKLAV